ncbi:class I SAM-dependent methyltransferase [Nocardioides yefusunii]|uniref:Class I SAM-dependent methyltransferase n=1 Tax=Nocardioides yefusunii TaxID=2500546 RepID=A0ABW1QXG2_9ACTN|nr:methyltransferase [Nocardioides yefusunii]
MSETTTPDFFERDAWEERYAGDGQTWSGKVNPQLAAEVSTLTPGTALDMGCGEGADVIWLATQGWQATGADFSAAGLARAARAAEGAGVAERCDWLETDARTFDASTLGTGPLGDGGRTWDLVTSHFLHPAAGGMSHVLPRLAAAVAPGGHLLVVGHAPIESFIAQMDEEKRAAMFFAADLVEFLPEGFEVVTLDQRPRTVVREGAEMQLEDSTLLARRTA